MVDDRAALLRLASGFMQTQALAVAVELGIPELLADRAHTSFEIAEATGAPEPVLRRLLRALAGLEVLGFDGSVATATQLTHLLRPGVPGSVGSLLLFMRSWSYQRWAESLSSFTTGEQVRFEGLTHFEWLETHAVDAALFDAAMEAGAKVMVRPLLARDWSSVQSVVDVGGGTGGLLVTLLHAHPHLRGTVVDRDHVAARAEAAIEAAGLADRCTFTPGDFFVHVPAGADVYLLSRVLHDWPDQDAGRILRTVREAAAPESRLLVVDAVLSDAPGWQWGHWLDLNMLVLLGGKERDAAEWEALFEANHWRMRHASSGDSVLEAIPD